MYLMHANLFLSVILAHWISDFVLQSNWMATNKSKSNRALGAHVVTYTVSMGLLLAIMQPGFFMGSGLPAFVSWVIANGALHFITDYMTSRITGRLWANGRTHDFFVAVGLDQMIHYACLFYTMWWLI